MDAPFPEFGEFEFHAVQLTPQIEKFLLHDLQALDGAFLFDAPFDFIEQIADVVGDQRRGVRIGIQNGDDHRHELGAAELHPVLVGLVQGGVAVF